MKQQYQEVATYFITNLQSRFPTQDLMDALELFTHNINYNQNLKKFNVHSAIIKTTFYQPKKAKLDEVWVPSLFYAIALNLQRSLFVLTMCKNVQLAMQKPFDVNLITKLWKTFISL